MSKRPEAEIKDRLREALNYAGMKPIDLSKATGIPRSMLSYYLKGKTKPKADRVHIIAKALGVSEVWLIGYDVPMERTAAQKSNDDLVQIIVRMRKDPEFLGAVSKLASLPRAEYDSILLLLSRLGK